MAAAERWRRQRTSSGYLNVLVGPRYCTDVRVDGVEVVQATLMLALNNDRRTRWLAALVGSTQESVLT